MCYRVLTGKHYGQYYFKGLGSSRRGEIIRMSLKEIQRLGVDGMGQNLGSSEQSTELSVSTKWADFLE
jgi:hypothetical protein